MTTHTSQTVSCASYNKRCESIFANTGVSENAFAMFNRNLAPKVDACAVHWEGIGAFWEEK